MLENYLIIIEKSKDGYGAYCPDVPGCAATGKTKEEARKEFLQALEFHFEGLKEDGLPIPKPSSSFAFTAEDCSGVLNVRTKKSTHLKLIKMAEQENVSVSHLVNDAIIKQYG
jgi:predicted RNase H-like HicB family nuclease